MRIYSAYDYARHSQVAIRGTRRPSNQSRRCRSTERRRGWGARNQEKRREPETPLHAPELSAHSLVAELDLRVRRRVALVVHGILLRADKQAMATNKANTDTVSGSVLATILLYGSQCTHNPVVSLTLLCFVSSAFETD